MYNIKVNGAFVKIFIVMWVLYLHAPLTFCEPILIIRRIYDTLVL